MLLTEESMTAGISVTGNLRLVKMNLNISGKMDIIVNSKVTGRLTDGGIHRLKENKHI